MYNGKTVAAVIVAAGSGTRMKRDKMLLPLCGASVIARTTATFMQCGFFDEIIIVASSGNLLPFSEEMKKHGMEKAVRIVKGGSTRSESSLCGIMAAESEYVMIHDGARPLVTKDIIERTLSECLRYGAAAAAVAPKDTIKKLDKDGLICATVPREGTVLIQTPQAFVREEIKKAYSIADAAETDDCAVFEKTGAKIAMVDGSYENIKLTTSEDLITAQEIIYNRNNEKRNPTMRIGTGFDTHRLQKGRDLVIGGVKIPYEKGLLGHSDADVLVHAVIDALFGAAALGDIGTHFPDTAEEYKGISSILLLERAAKKVRSAGYEIGNIDTTIIAQAPKMAPYIEAMQKNLANAMGVDVSDVSVKAKSNEHMGFTGRGEGIEARAVALLVKP